MATEIIPIEPNRLKMIWQSQGEDRTKYQVGEIIRSGHQTSLSYFRHEPTFLDALMAGFEGYPAFPLNKTVHHENVIETFSRRIPPRSRNDYHTYLTKNRISTDYQISDFALLGYTGGYLPSDGFSFAIDWRFQELPFIYLMEISGFRHHVGMHIDINNLLGKQIQFIPEPENEYDINAVAIYLADMKIGYVPRYYNKEFLFWSDYYNIYGQIERIDGKMLKPKVSVLTIVQTRQVAAVEPRVSF